jgi:hypothetical protein
MYLSRNKGKMVKKTKGEFVPPTPPSPPLSAEEMAASAVKAANKKQYAAGIDNRISQSFNTDDGIDKTPKKKK